MACVLAGRWEFIRPGGQESVCVNCGEKCLRLPDPAGQSQLITAKVLVKTIPLNERTGHVVCLGHERTTCQSFFSAPLMQMLC